MAYVIEMTIAGGVGLYGYGATERDAWADARRQWVGTFPLTQTLARRRMIGRPVSDDLASEIEEMLSADVIGWTVTQRV